MKKFKILLAMLVSVLIIAGCSDDGESSSGDDNKVTVWAWDESFNIKAVNEAVKAYKQKEGVSDIEVEVVTMAQEDVVQKLNTSLASGNLDGLPEIVLVEDYRIPGYLTSFPDAFEPLTDIVDESAFSSYKFAVSKVGNERYGLPFDSGVAGLFYRTDYLEKAGYTGADLENITWERYVEIAKDVKDKTGQSFVALNPSDLAILRIMTHTAGSWYLKKDGQTLDLKDNDVLKEALKVYVDLMNSGTVTLTSDWNSGVSAVNTGTVATAPTGAWYAGTIMAAEDQSGKWAIAPIPRLGAVSNSVNASSLGGSSWYVLKGVGNTDLAKEFLANTFATEADLMNTLVDEIGLVSTLNAAKETENYTAENAFFSNQKIFENFSTWSKEIPSVNYGMHTYAIENILAVYVQKIIEGADIDKALADAEKEIEAAIKN